MRSCRNKSKIIVNHFKIYIRKEKNKKKSKNRGRDKPRKISPKDPLPILRPSLYLPPTIRSMLRLDQRLRSIRSSKLEKEIRRTWIKTIFFLFSGFYPLFSLWETETTNKRRLTTNDRREPRGFLRKKKREEMHRRVVWGFMEREKEARWPVK